MPVTIWMLRSGWSVTVRSDRIEGQALDKVLSADRRTLLLESSVAT